MHPIQAQREFRKKEYLLETTLRDACRWACKRRYQQFDGELEPYSVKRYPYLRAIYNSRAPWNYIMKGAQMGLTELAVNIALFVLVKLQHSVMYVLPTGEGVEEFSRARVMVAVKQSAWLLSKIDPTVRIYQCGAFTLYMRGAKKDHNLKSVPVQSMILDEVDEIKEHAVQLAFERLSGQDDGYLLMLSTPTYPGIGIDAKIQESTQNHYFFGCPSCSRTIELLYPESFVLCGDRASDPRTEESHWRCHECKRKIGDKEKVDLFNASGKWIATNSKASPQHQGWWIHQGYSPRVTAYKFAIAVHNSRLSIDANREFHNSKLALPHSEEGAQIGDKHITECYGQHALADAFKFRDKEIRILGNDPGDRHYWAVCAYSFDPSLDGDINDRTRSRLIGYGWLPERTAFGELWTIARDYGVRFAAMDIGGDPRGSRAFTRRCRGLAMPVRYVTGRPARDIIVADEDGDCPVANVDRHAWLTATFNRIFEKRQSFPLDLDPQFREHLKAQVRRTRVNDAGIRIREYVRPENKEDHWAHALNYCEIGLRLFETHGIGSPRSDVMR